MNQKAKNITLRIAELDTEIQKLEQQLAATIWERKKYLQFSENNIHKLDNSSIK